MRRSQQAMAGNEEMMRARGRILALVLLALGVLTGIAVLNTRARFENSMSQVREDARLVGRLQAEKLQARLEESVSTGPVFDDLPQPGFSGPVDEVLRDGSLEELVRLRSDRFAGMTEMGLPRRVLAAWKIYEETGDARDGRELVELAMGSAASVITPLILEKLPDSLVGESESDWAEIEEATGVLRRHGEVDERGLWVMDRGEWWWLASTYSTLKFLSPEKWSVVVNEVFAGEDGATSFRLKVDGVLIAGEEGGVALAEVDLPVGRNLRLEVVADSERFMLDARRQAAWTYGSLGVALALAAGGLWLMFRSQRREMELSELKSGFVASVSHELRAPVASIRLMAESLVENRLPPEDVAEFQRLIALEGARLSGLVQNVLNLSEIERGTIEWRISESDVVELVAETCRILEPLAAEQSVSIEFRGELASSVQRVDGSAVRQALVNLIENAVKFSEPEGKVWVDLSEDDRSWRIEVGDQGCGISQENQRKIFDRFYRLGNELRRETRGTGIGLYLVNAIAKAHGGEVSVESEPGKGSVFTMKFPKDENTDR